MLPLQLSAAIGCQQSVGFGPAPFFVVGSVKCGDTRDGGDMSETYLPLIYGAFGLIGAMIGGVIAAAASLGGIVIQSKIQDRRAAVRLAADLALHDYKLRREASPRSTFPPASVFVAYEVQIMKLIERGKLTPESYKSVSRKYDKLQEAAYDLAAERFAEAKAKAAPE